MSNYLTTDGLKNFSLLPEAPLRPEARGICHICHMVNPARPPKPKHTRRSERVNTKQVCVQLLRTLTTWHCPHSPSAAAAIDLLPAWPTAANLQRRRAAAGWDRQTDGRTRDRGRTPDSCITRGQCQKFDGGWTFRSPRIPRISCFTCVNHRRLKIWW